MKKMFAGLLVLVLLSTTSYGANLIRIDVSPSESLSNQNVIDAFKKAATYKGKPVEINFKRGTYRLSRAESVQKLYYISNTTSEVEDADPTKHIGLHLENLENVTVNGNGSTFMMTGKMTSFIVDNCKNIVLKNMNFDYEYPTQTEIEVIEEGEKYIKAKVHPTSQYRIKDGVLEWYGEGWSYTQGIAQAYDYKSDITWRTWSPLNKLVKTTELEPNLLLMEYTEKPKAGVGLVYQMRDAIRDEVCGFIHKSSQVLLEDINYYYLGNFGIVGQYSSDISFNRNRFAPELGSGRTNAGFADFIQISGCKGLIDIQNSYFAGAHDDPINIHGTHLQVTEFISDKELKVKFMHHQSYGFDAFFKGDDVEFIDRESLISQEANKVVAVERISGREIKLTLKNKISTDVLNNKSLVVENVTWTPEVNIVNNYFGRIPSRGLLVTTRRKVNIENNTFYAMQMSGILIADDAMSWYESGMAKDVTIHNNTFIDCKSPIIFIQPENRVDKGYVHSNIRIENNTFKGVDGTVVSAKSVLGLDILDNLIILNKEMKEDDIFSLKQVKDVKVVNNRIETKK